MSVIVTVDAGGVDPLKLLDNILRESIEFSVREVPNERPGAWGKTSSPRRQQSL
jgi:hypothetical protein